MIRSPTSRGRPHGHAVGFTLIEVLVVVAITGIILAVAAVNLFPDDAQVARRESGQVALAIEQARDAAWFGGRPTSVTIGAGRLNAFRLNGDAWQADPAHELALDSSLRVVSLYVDGQELKPDERLVFLPDGLGIPFRVALQVRGLQWAVEGDAAGGVTLVPG
jgi:general secretion pathway protein H